MEEKDFKNAIEALMSGFDAEEQKMFNVITSNYDFKDFKDAEEFNYKIAYTFKKLQRQLIKSKVSDNQNVIFIYMNYNYVERFFNNVIQANEGTACCSDKSSTIVDRLVDFFLKGKKIEFNYDAEYTFHLPKKVFTNHDSIIAFYEVIKGLHYGNFNKLIEYANEDKNIFKQS